MSNTAIRMIFKTDEQTYLEEIVVFSGEGAELSVKINGYVSNLLELNPGWKRIGKYVGSQTSSLEGIMDGTLVWHCFYESSLSEEEYYELKYGLHS